MFWFPIAQIVANLRAKKEAKEKEALRPTSVPRASPYVQGSSTQPTSQNDLLNPLNPLSPFSVYQHVPPSVAREVSEYERPHSGGGSFDGAGASSNWDCSPSSSEPSSYSSSDSCSSSNYDSSSSSSYDSGSSSSSYD